MYAFPSTHTMAPMVFYQNKLVMQHLISTFFSIPDWLLQCGASRETAVTIAPLQHVMYAIARWVAGVGPRDHLTRTLCELHWLPVVYRLRYKLFIIMHAAIMNESSKYINDIFTTTALIPGRSNIRLTDSCLWCATLWNLRRAFSVTGPREWNELPADLRLITEISTFKSKF